MFRHYRLIRASFLLVALLGCGRGEPTPSSATNVLAPSSHPSTAIFKEVAGAAGIVASYDNGEDSNLYTMLETLGGGVAVFDYDRDGRMDVFVAGGGRILPEKVLLGLPGKLFRNEGNWRFREVASEAGLTEPLFYTHGCAVGDYDNDGWPDLLVTGYGRLALYHNEKGKFREVTKAAGLLADRPLHWSTSAGWGDFNGDGLLDLFVAHYVDWSWQNNPRCPGYHPGQEVDTCSPKSFQPVPDALFLNNGDGTFRDASVEAGIKRGAEAGKGLGVLIADFDEDGRLDVYVANDTTENHLYLNRGNGRFEEAGGARGVAVGESGKPDGSMGVDAADFDGSGHLSIFCTNFQGEVHGLYRGGGQGKPFHHVSTRTGVSALGLAFVGFGTAFLDYDGDGAEDLIITNGHVARHPAAPSTLAQRPVLLRNLRKPGDRPTDVRFANASSDGGPYFQSDHRGRGLALGDFDNDGRIDVVVSHVREPVAILRNELANDHHWLGVELIGRPQPDAVGAVATLEVNGQKLIRVRKGGGSYLSANDPRIVFGLGKNTTIGTLTVRWPNGDVQSWTGLPIDQYVKLEQAPPGPSP